MMSYIKINMTYRLLPSAAQVPLSAPTHVVRRRRMRRLAPVGYALRRLAR